jgi:hypothetical protein
MKTLKHLNSSKRTYQILCCLTANTPNRGGFALYLILLASLSCSIKQRISSTLTGPYCQPTPYAGDGTSTFLTMLLPLSSMNSTRTCCTAPREPVRPRIFMTRAYLGCCCLTSTTRDRQNNINGRRRVKMEGTACRGRLFILLFFGLLGFFDHDGVLVVAMTQRKTK